MTPARALALLVALGAAACAPDEIVVTRLPSEEPEPGLACSRQADCGPGAYCQRRSCDGLGGTCVVRPASCDQTPGPVCGCDGITYFNDCLRQQSGIGLAREGECGVDAVRCGGRQDVSCPRASYCAKLRATPACSRADELGTCWVVPGCEGDVGHETFVRCEDAHRNDCVSLCEAVRSERPHFSASSCAG